MECCGVVTGDSFNGKGVITIEEGGNGSTQADEA
jgi:hypothetical protein